MATTIRTNGLQHAISLGNIEVSSKSNSIHTYNNRCYDSEDETMTRRKTRPQSVGLFPRGSIYSKGDIREQYCVTDRQLQNSIERPRRERFFGCLSGRGAPQSFLGVCVGRRAPSDENLTDYAPFYKYPRYHQNGLSPYDDDLESSYFRRRPATILSTGSSTDAKQYAWMSSDDETVRLEPSRPISSIDYEDFQRGPYIVGGAYSPKSYLSRSTEQISGIYRCPAHVGLPPPPPPPVLTMDPTATPRTKHVSFARSHTLTSFNEAAAMGLRSSGRSLKSTRSHERLIGGKKPVMTFGTIQDHHHQVPQPQPLQQQQQPQIQHQHPPPQQAQIVSFHHHNHPQIIAHHQHPLQQLPQQQMPTQATTMVGHQITAQPIAQYQAIGGLPTGGSILGFLVQPTKIHQQPVHQPLRQLHQHQSSLSPEVVVVEKIKRGGMKTQATQTDQRKAGLQHLNLSLSPRTIHRVKMVSQGAQTNGMNGRKLTKSLSEMPAGARPVLSSISTDQFVLDEFQSNHEHEQLHRTYSEEPPRSPLMVFPPQQLSQHRFYEPPPPPIGAFKTHSRASSRTSTENPQSSSLAGHLSGHSRNHSQDSAMSFRSSADMPHLYSPYEPGSSIPSVQSIATQADGLTSTTNTAANSLDFHQSQFPYDNLVTYKNITGYNKENHAQQQQQQQQQPYVMPQFDFESNSLPRRTCGYHKGHDAYYSYSLPRRDHIHPQEVPICRHATECAELLNNSRNSMKMKFDREFSRQSSTDSNQTGYERRRASTVGIDITPKTHIEYRRPSMPVHTKFSSPHIKRGLSTDTDEDTTSRTDEIDEVKEEEDDDSGSEVPSRKKTCRSDEEKEIFIDFKPHISPTPSPRRRKHLQKTLSEGEILIDKHQSHNLRDAICVGSASDDDLTSEKNYYPEKHYYYQNIPIKDEGICDRKTESKNTLEIPTKEDQIRQKREAFRKRSVSLEDPTAEEEPRQLKSDPPSPCQEDGTGVTQSAYPSSDSLANDLTRDHSDGIWNESQVTVLPADLKNGDRIEQMPALLTPSSKRKNLILQHQQRSSIDTDALDLEEQFSDHSLPQIPLPKLKPASTQTAASIKSPGQITPTIAVIPALNTDAEEEETESAVIFKKSSRTLSPCLQERRKVEPLIHSISPKRMQPESSESHLTNVHHDNVHHQHIINRSDYATIHKNNTDISECSTNTDEYITCTENSKKTPGRITPPTTATSSSSTQVPVSAQSSQTVQEGSSFESASSLYSTRGDGLSEDNPQTDEVPSSNELPQLRSLITKPTQIVVSNDVCLPIGKLPEITSPLLATKPSPSHSLSSSTSDSYNLTETARKKTTVATITPQPQKTPTSPIRVKAGVISGSTKIITTSKKKSESISEDEKSEVRYSSSGYYESPHDDEMRLNAKQRRARIEEERRRRKNNMKLDIERENLRALTSPIKKSTQSQSVPQQKEQQQQQQQQQQHPIKSPEDYRNSALNVLDGTSPSKMKRFRPKIKRQTRKTSVPETVSISSNIVRKTKILSNKSPDKYADSHITTKISPSKYEKQTQLSPKKQHKSCSGETTQQDSEKRLKAKSIESLRSVSPGSDSVFYSEADLAPEQQVHCLHCGKEVEIITAPSGSHESISALPRDEERDIVKPPADFADSPVTTKTSQRLYKKMDKRFRSEERHGDRSRHYKNRQENVRAKSEERGKDVITRSPPALRPAGSSPCVLPDDSIDPDAEKLSPSHISNGMYSRLTDSDVWIQLDHQSFDRHRDRRGSTDSEKAFQQKYQVILHRLVQRRCTLEMYHRQKQNIFNFGKFPSPPNSLRGRLEEILRLMLIVWAREGQAIKTVTGKPNEIDKTVYVKSDSGEFGFRIHGSKPVVVAAIEPDTPAESSGLEVGDIIISVNGIQVLDKHHTEVVKIAHAGCETLELEVARTIGVLMNEQQDTSTPALYTGYLWRQTGQAKGSPNTKKWVKRWFSLRPDHCVYYYKSESDTQPVGAVMLTNHTVEHCSIDVGRNHAFKIDSGEGVPMFLAADNEETKNRWVAVLSHASTQADPWLEISSRNLKQPPNGIVRPDCFGYLMKLGSRWNGWSKRYCVLKDACMYFYAEGNSKCAFGMASFQGYKIVAMSTNAAGRKNSFEIVPPDSKFRHYVFSTETEMDKKRWISALEYSIDRWIKAK